MRVLVVIEAMLSAVATVMLKANTMMPQAPSKPALPTTQPSRRYMMTPRMVSNVGVNTPPKVPNFFMGER